MKFTTKIGAIATAAALTAVPSYAALLDFTNDSVGVPVDGTTVMGNIAGGISYTLTSNVGGLNRDQAFDGPSVAAVSPLAAQNDGFGIDNDEITDTLGGVFQSITITFSEVVTISTAYFLDVFDDETGRILIGTASDSATFTAEAPGVAANGGFTSVSGSFEGSVFTFFAGPGQDDASADVSLAALTINAVPLPAGMLLLGTALGGLGLSRRRKKSA